MHQIHFHTKHHQFQRFNVQLELYMKKEKTENKKVRFPLDQKDLQPIKTRAFTDIAAHITNTHAQTSE